MNIFVDTNLIVYPFDNRQPAKQVRARALLQALKSGGDRAVIYTQVMQESYNTLVQKLGVSKADAAAELRVLMTLETVIMTPDLILAAAELQATASVSFWDAMIIRAAQHGRCAELWTEDMQDGRRFGTVEVVNPITRR